MPQNIVVGEEAEAVARFVAEYAGNEAESSPRPGRDLALARGDMLDLKLIRSDPERVKAALARRGAAEQVDELLALDARRRELLPEVENAQAERKTLSKQIGEAKQAGEEAEELMATVQGVEGDDRGRQGGAGEGRGRARRLARRPPQPARPRAPEGMTEEDAVVLREVGARPSSTSSRATTSRSAPSWA